MTFEDAVKASPHEVQASLRPGKQALKGAHREQVTCPDSRRFTGSIDLDAALAATQEHSASSRWDYGIGLRVDDQEIAIWVEIHPASAGEVNTVLRKHKWLRTWLQEEAPALNSLTTSQAGVRRYIWLATASGVNLRPGSREARRLNEAGISSPRHKLELK